MKRHQATAWIRWVLILASVWLSHLWVIDNANQNQNRSLQMAQEAARQLEEALELKTNHAAIRKELRALQDRLRKIEHDTLGKTEQ